MAIEDLTNQLKQLKEHGEADLQLSEFARDQYLATIRDLRGVIKTQRDKAYNLRVMGQPGAYTSAQETKNRLLLNVTGFDGIVETLDKYLDYLDAFEATVNAAFKRLHGEDQASGPTTVSV